MPYIHNMELNTHNNIRFKILIFKYIRRHHLFRLL